MNNKSSQNGFTLIEVTIVSALAMILIIGGLSGMTWINQNFYRINKRSVAVSAVDFKNKTLKSDFARYPKIIMNGQPVTYVECLDLIGKPQKNKNGKFGAFMISLSKSEFEKLTGECPHRGYETHLTWSNTAANSNEKNVMQYAVIKIEGKGELIYNEQIYVPF